MPGEGRAISAVPDASASAAIRPDAPAVRLREPTSAGAVVDAAGVTRRFGRQLALDGVSLRLEAGEIHALVGPNGAGKTTLLRVLTGLVEADGGSVRVLGLDPARSPREVHRRLGVVASGSRSFYLRISGFENLVFFARLHGLRRRAAARRAAVVLEAVQLTEARDKPVSAYSTGMQRRLAIARALLPEPSLLLMDEATHDLDPRAAARVRELVSTAAATGAAVLWTTQRLEEIKGFSRNVTLLDRGTVRFTGSVPRLLAHALHDQYLLRLSSERRPPGHLLRGDTVVGTLTLHEGEDEHYTLTLASDAILGDALESLLALGIRVLSCSEARPSVEQAFMSLVGGEPA